MEEAVAQASRDHCDLIVFSELAVCGYPPKDLLDYPSFIRRCTEAIDKLRLLSGNIGILVGAPTPSNLQRGKKLYNGAFFLHEQKVQAIVHKGLLPTYDIFDEYRYFEPADHFETVEFKGYKLAVTICEDLWNLSGDHLYKVTPMDELMKEDPDIMINLSGSPYSYNHVEERRSRMQQNASHYQLPLIYVNQVGGNTDVLFDGGSMFINHKGEIAEECAFFEEDYLTVDWDPQTEYHDDCEEYHDHDIRLIHDAVVMGIRDYFQKSGFTKAILGSSGGIDSAVVNALAAEALGSENVTAVLMPSPYSSEGSVNDARDLANNLNCPFHIIPITDVFNAFNDTLKPVFGDRPHDVTEENLQARSRGVMVMAMSNKFGGIVLNTSNKSESAVGYTTLYGDMCGGLSVIGDLYKTQVYEMARFINRKREIIPESIIVKPPSAELRPGQKDADSLPPYDLLDQILYHYIEEQKGWEEIDALGFDPDVVRKIAKLVDRNEYKRFQAAPTLRISHKAFGTGRRMPIVAKYYH